MRKLVFKWSRCPWHTIDPVWSSKPGHKEKYGWNPWTDPGAGRFGGWWVLKCGIVLGRSEMIVEWIFGTLRISWVKQP